MNWPPAKAWTSKYFIDDQVHFVAINYGGDLLDRWVILMSVLDSSIIVNISWSQLVDQSYWICGWDENNYLHYPKLVTNKFEERTTIYTHPSADSGLTIPITKNKIRPWFSNI